MPSRWAGAPLAIGGAEEGNLRRELGAGVLTLAAPLEMLDQLHNAYARSIRSTNPIREERIGSATTR